MKQLNKQARTGQTERTEPMNPHHDHDNFYLETTAFYFALVVGGIITTVGLYLVFR